MYVYTDACAKTDSVKIKKKPQNIQHKQRHKDTDTHLWFQLSSAFINGLFSSQTINNLGVIQFSSSLVFQPLSFFPFRLKTHTCTLKTERACFRVHLDRAVSEGGFQMQKVVKWKPQVN